MWNEKNSIASQKFSLQDTQGCTQVPLYVGYSD